MKWPFKKGDVVATKKQIVGVVVEFKPDDFVLVRKLDGTHETYYGGSLRKVSGK